MGHDLDDAIDPLEALREECRRELPAERWDDVLALTKPLTQAERARLTANVLARTQRSRRLPLMAAAACVAALALFVAAFQLLPQRASEEATRLTVLAEASRRDQHYAEAEALYKRALQLQERALGPEHVAVASTLTELAELYASQQLYAKAKPLYNRAFQIQPTEVF